MRALGYLILTNLAVLIALSVVMSVVQAVLGVRLDSGGWVSSFVFASLFGFGGAFFSLMISKFAATRSVGAKVIWKSKDPEEKLASLQGVEKWLVETVREHANRRSIKMPDVALYDSPTPNAFATGPSKNNSLVAISTGLLRIMSEDEAEAVIGHEMTHVSNGDMVAMTLIQGVLNTFVIFIANLVSQLVSGRSDGRSRHGNYLVYILLQTALGFVASIIAAWFSRQREFRADQGGAELVSSTSMAGALRALQRMQDAPDDLPDKMAAFGIRSGGLGKLFSTHPPLEERIARLAG